MNILDRICTSLFMSRNELMSFALSAPYRYKRYYIEKRNSEQKRLIAHPSKELKYIQRLIVKVLDTELPIHDDATAYRKGSSIKLNAQKHSGNCYFLKMDFKEFFPSITPSVFFRELSAAGFEIEDSDAAFLSNILFWKRKRNSPLRMSIGAPSSPLISNFVMYRFDCEVSKFCNENEVTYTRYADDLAFSTNKKDVLYDFPKVIKKIVREIYSTQLRINSEKTVYCSKKNNRHITGVTINNNGELSLGREKKRNIRVLIHRFQLGLLDDTEKSHLAGLLSHAYNIEPSFILRMRTKYGNDTMNTLVKSNK